MAVQRLHLALTETVAARLDKLQAATGSVSRAETIRRALSTLELLTDTAAAGGCVIARTKDGEDHRIALI